MAKSSVTDNFNSPLAVKLRELLKHSSKTGGKTTYKILAEYLNVKQQSVSSWVNGTTVPDTKHIAPIAEYFGVTTDYLLRDISIRSGDDVDIEIEKRFGLDEKAIQNLTNMHNTIKGYVNLFLGHDRFRDYIKIIAAISTIRTDEIIHVLTGKMRDYDAEYRLALSQVDDNLKEYVINKQAYSESLKHNASIVADVIISDIVSFAINDVVEKWNIASKQYKEAQNGKYN